MALVQIDGRLSLISDIIKNFILKFLLNLKINFIMEVSRIKYVHDKCK